MFGNISSKINSILKKKEKKNLNLSQNTASSSSYSPNITEPIEKKKNFNIKLSDEDDKDIYNLGEDDDDEEYEEEEEENEKIKQRAVTEVGDNKMEEEICTKSNDSSNKNNIPVYIQQNNENNNENNENKNINNENKIEEINQENNFFIEDLSYCHTIRRKNTIIDLREVQSFFIQKMKIKKKFFNFSFLRENMLPQNYIIFFEENFIYFCKNIIISKTNSNLRKVGNKYSLFKIENITIEEDVDNKYIIRIEILIDKIKNTIKSKEFTIELKYINNFINVLTNKFQRYGISQKMKNLNK
jgi:hypothetical protein